MPQTTHTYIYTYIDKKIIQKIFGKIIIIFRKKCQKILSLKRFKQNLSDFQFWFSTGF